MNATPFESLGSRSNGSPVREATAREAGAGREEGPRDPSQRDANGRSGDAKRVPEAPPPTGNGSGNGNGAGGSNQPTDEQLLAAYREGDKPSFAALVERYQRELYHFLVRFLGNRAAAEDVFQETFLQVHQSAEAFDLQRRFKPWLFTIAANKARDLIRSQARRPTNPLQASISGGDDEGGEFIDLMKASIELPDEPLARQETQHKVQQVVASMPEHLREILILSYFQTFPYRQIADILGIPLGTVKSRLHAAVATFAEKWKAANRSRASS